MHRTEKKLMTNNTNQIMNYGYIYLFIFWLIISMGCSKSDSETQRSKLFKKAQESGKQASVSANESQKVNIKTHQLTHKTGECLNNAKETFQKEELVLAVKEATKTIKTAEDALGTGNSITKPVEATYSHIDEAIKVVTELKHTSTGGTITGKESERLKSITQEIGAARKLAKSSAEGAEYESRLAEQHKKEAEDILRIIAQLKKDRQLSKQAALEVDQAGKITQTVSNEVSNILADAGKGGQQGQNGEEKGNAQGRAVEGLEEKAEAKKVDEEKKGDGNELPKSGEHDNKIMQTIQMATRAHKLAGIAHHNASMMQDLSGSITDILGENYVNSEISKTIRDVNNHASQISDSALRIQKKADESLNILNKLVDTNDTSTISHEGMSKLEKSEQDVNIKENATGSKTNDDIDLTQIPSIPSFPKALPNPKGAYIPVSNPKATGNIYYGSYRQVVSNNKSDFLPGGYSERIFIFRVDNILEVCHKYGKNNDISITWRIGYQWNSDHTRLLLGQEIKHRPSTVSLSGFSIGNNGIGAMPASVSLPVELTCKVQPDGCLLIGGKSYQSYSPKQNR